MSPSASPAATEPADPQGRVLEIQRMSTDDGPGIRTTVFFKGCSLSCSWCHNPESISPRPELVWHEQHCIGCRSCVEACPAGARQLDEHGARRDGDRCRACYQCVEACPTTAVERLGTDWELEPLVAELGKDRAYFEASGGGITLSGGEPVLQHRFVRALLRRCRQEHLHTALDTAGLCGTEALLELCELTDLVLFDLKEMDDERHRQLTGHSNERILANARAVAERLAARRGTDGNAPRLWIRTPLIPDATARADNLQAIGAFIAAELADGVDRWELCAFNNMCQDKYRRLGRHWAHPDATLLTEVELERYAELARATAVAPGLVHADGPTRLTPDGTP